MKLTTFLVATIATGLASAASLREFQIEERTAQAAAPVDPAPFRLERPGRVFHNATPRGVVEKVGGIDTYLSYIPGRKSRTETAILFLSDIFGLPLINNKQLADAFAKAGYFVALPDLFDGEPVPWELMGTPGWNMTAWRLRHPQSRIENITETTIKALRANYGVKKIGAVGYCFGGKYVTRFLAPGRGLDAGFVAHTSNTILADWEGISLPISVAFGELDGSSTPAMRAAAEQVFTVQNKTFQTTLYSNAEHGWAVRTNLTDPQKRFAQKTAFSQALNWFDTWIKGQ